MKKIVILLMTVLLLLTVASCGKKTPKNDPNAVLTDSNVPLELGAEIWENESTEAGETP